MRNTDFNHINCLIHKFLQYRNLQSRQIPEGGLEQIAERVVPEPEFPEGGHSGEGLPLKKSEPVVVEMKTLEGGVAPDGPERYFFEVVEAEVEKLEAGQSLEYRSELVDVAELVVGEPELLEAAAGALKKKFRMNPAYPIVTEIENAEQRQPLKCARQNFDDPISSEREPIQRRIIDEAAFGQPGHPVALEVDDRQGRQIDGRSADYRRVGDHVVQERDLFELGQADEGPRVDPRDAAPGDVHQGELRQVPQQPGLETRQPRTAEDVELLQTREIPKARRRELDQGRRVDLQQLFELSSFSFLQDKPLLLLIF